METATAGQRIFRVFVCCLLAVLGSRTLAAAAPAPAPNSQIVDAAAQAAIPLPTADGSSARAILNSPARMTIFFWPAAGRCSPVEFGLIGTLEQIQKRFPDARILTVIPEDFPGTERYGATLPGTVLRVPRREHTRENEQSPFPRIEVWDQHQHLLLFRAISGLRSEADTLATEIERARGLTRPVEPAAQAAQEKKR
jgi:hypothetical protein